MTEDKQAQQDFLEQFKEPETAEQIESRQKLEAKNKEADLKLQQEAEEKLKKEKESKIPESTLTPEGDLSNDKLIELLAKKGITVSSLDDLKPKLSEAEIKDAEEKRKGKMVAYGIETGKFKIDDYNTLQKLQENKTAIFIDELTSEIKAANPEITEDQLSEQLKEYTLSHLDENDPRRKRREKELNIVAEQRLKEQFGSIYNLPSEFENYEKSEQSKYQLQRKIEAGLPVYKEDVKNIIEWVKKQDFVIEDKEHPENNVSIPFEFNEAKLKQITDAFLTESQIVQSISNGYDLEAMKQQAKMFLIGTDIESIVNHSAKHYNSTQKDKYINGRKNLIPSRELDTGFSTAPSTLLEQFAADVLTTTTQKEEVKV